jgi:hydrogenase maturation protein HypF
MTTAIHEGRHIELCGTVQGVGMRPWIYRLAQLYGVTGRVWNHANGVTVRAFGPAHALDTFVQALGAEQPPAAHTDTIVASAIEAEDVQDFQIIGSQPGLGRRVSIPSDLATCPDCLAEIFEPADRRYRYAFTNCTNCGPRFTIARDVPYDRSTTTMAPFPMCARCQREYREPANRRFHAEPNACPDCGPHLLVLSADGERAYLPEGSDPVAYVARAITAGRIVAVKGLGGFHLACDATSSAAVARLRARKHRDEKPLAVMVRDLQAAERVAVVADIARPLLESSERPIVLVPRRADADLAPEVAPGNPLVGVMLAYTPLHHLLLADSGVPLVMTSANISDEPIAYTNEDAVSRLRGIADLFLVHNRVIVTRCDDSIMTVIGGGPAVLRRSRGFVPRAISLATPVAVPTLACGALLKNTFCLAYEREAWLGPHIGDLENALTYQAYQDAIARMERFLGVCPAIVAHDVHPDYLSTRYAFERGLPAVAVQHHHAHVASAIAEHGIAGPALGIAFDGSGFGNDGTAWGGEFLFGDARAVTRVATFRPILLPGGDAAVRHPWRTALSLLVDAMGDAAPVDSLPLFSRLAANDIQVLRRMLASEFHTPAARGVGRYFDGIGALVLSHGRARYEGQVAFELNMAADPQEQGGYDYAIDRSVPLLEIDFRPMVRAVVADLLKQVPQGIIAARFHNTLTAATATVVRELGERLFPNLPAGASRPLRIVLTGGCFQNARLTESVVAALNPENVVYVHRRVPPGDGGIALGQAIVAAVNYADGHVDFAEPGISADCAGYADSEDSRQRGAAGRPRLPSPPSSLK